MNTPHVQVILDQNAVPGALRTALNRVQARVSLRSMDKALSNGISPSADVCVILPQRRGATDVLDRILADASDRACATLVIPPAGGLTEQAPSLNQSARRLAPSTDDDPSMNPDELTGRIKALCEIRSPLRRMREELATLRRREAEHRFGSRQLEEQLRLASEIQRDLLPGTLPDTSPLKVTALYLPADYVSGDIYDVSRLDEDHLALSLADATGHGMPAALLTIFIKKSFQGKEITGETYRILEPDELLGRLNDEILETGLSQCQFVTGLHAIFNRLTRRIRWARGGVPYPILIQPDRPPRRMHSAGTLMGAFEGPSFEVIDRECQPGETLLFFTDGLEALLSKHDPAFATGNIEESTWIRLLIGDGVEQASAELRRLAETTPDTEWKKDDITLLALRMND